MDSKADVGCRTVNKAIMDNFYDTIKDFILSGRQCGRVTEEISQHYKLSRRQVGSKMGKLKAKGLVMTYTKGTIVFSDGLHNKKGSPMRLSHSYYEWVAV